MGLLLREGEGSERRGKDGKRGERGKGWEGKEEFPHLFNLTLTTVYHTHPINHRVLNGTLHSKLTL